MKGKATLKIKDKIITPTGEKGYIVDFYDGIAEIRYKDTPSDLDLKGQYYSSDLKKTK